MSFPFDEIIMSEKEHVDWVKSRNDPALWHACTIAMFSYLSDPHGFLVWLFQQPDVDRSTAGYAFLGWAGDAYLAGNVLSGGETITGPELKTILDTICRRSETMGFANDSLGLVSGFEADRLKCLDMLDRGTVASGVTFPHNLLFKPFPTPKPLAYFVEDGAVLDYDPNEF